MESGFKASSAPRQNLAISAYRQLKHDIIRGRYAPEQKLLMSHLKEHYGASTGPLREALSQLVADRLVVAISQRGYRVAPMSLAELNDIYDARAQLEGANTAFGYRARRRRLGSHGAGHRAPISESHRRQHTR
ncbi:hypothetical protein HSBAA_10230 [Vreelandella sulfidaeris]|uniref:HTH gntR-type domain-containing protein n=1 Tax=Vreelandella sulfidaeris TaxID=115553 RepID=A0A455U257_9GAMM|nr:hypothetical protein HSBAA_10230 [Halomonas sulfidaeris]